MANGRYQREPYSSEDSSILVYTSFTELHPPTDASKWKLWMHTLTRICGHVSHTHTVICTRVFADVLCTARSKTVMLSDSVINNYQNTRRTKRFQHDTARKHFSELSDPVIRATQKVKGIADCFRDDLSGDRGRRGWRGYRSCGQYSPPQECVIFRHVTCPR